MIYKKTIKKCSRKDLALLLQDSALAFWCLVGGPRRTSTPGSPYYLPPSQPVRSQSSTHLAFQATVPSPLQATTALQLLSVSTSPESLSAYRCRAQTSVPGYLSRLPACVQFLVSQVLEESSHRPKLHPQLRPWVPEMNAFGSHVHLHPSSGTQSGGKLLPKSVRMSSERSRSLYR